MIPTALPTSMRSTTNENEFTVRVLHSFAEAESFRAPWNDLVFRSGSDVYQTFDWCRLWWEYYGTNRELHLLLCFAGEELVGLIPAFVDNLGARPASLRVAKLVGSDFSLHLCNLPILPDAFQFAVAHAIRYFLGEHRCDVLLFGPLAGPAAHVDELLAIGQREPELVETAEAVGDSCNTYFQLPTDFDQYLKAIGKQQRGNFNRSVTTLGKNHRVVCDVMSTAGSLEAEFATFCELHDAQWRAEGKLGHFGDWPHARDFNRDLIRTLGAQGMVRFHRIFADDKLISSQFSFVFGGTIYWRLPARVSGPEWDKLSLGRMGLAKMIEAALLEGRNTVEGGRGHYAYKLQMGGVELPLRTVQFMRRGFGVSTRVAIFKHFGSLLNLVYYKVVFMRLAPRIPALQRPLWPFWIRFSW